MTHDEVARTAELVREINRTHALIVVEHDMQFVKMIARTVTVMHQGAVLVEDTMDRIMKNPTVRDVYLGKHGGARPTGCAPPPSPPPTDGFPSSTGVAPTSPPPGSSASPAPTAL